MKTSDFITAKSETVYQPTGRREKIVRANCLGHETTASTKCVACTQAVENVKAQIANAYERVIRWGKDGSCWILSYTFGWEYSILRPGSNHASGGCMMSVKTKREAEEQMLRHLEQYNEAC